MTAATWVTAVVEPERSRHLSQHHQQVITSQEVKSEHHHKAFHFATSSDNRLSSVNYAEESICRLYKADTCSGSLI
jgi:hypothetical protein